MATWLKGLRVNEISLVDRPANPGAVALLFKRKETDMPLDGDEDVYWKRAFSSDQRQAMADKGQALPDGSFPIVNTGDLKNAIQAIGRAKDPAKAKAHIIARAKALGATDALPDDWKGGKSETALDRLLTRLGLKKSAPREIDPETYTDAAGETVDRAMHALAKSLASILALPADQQAAAMEKTLEQCREHLDAELPAHIEKAMRDVALAAGAGGSATPQGDNQGEADMTLEELSKSLATLTAQVTKLTTDSAIQKLSKEHKDYLDKADMGDDAKAKFLAMSADERDAHMAKNPVKKADTGGDGANADIVAKAALALAENEDLKKRLAALEGDKELTAMQKRAVEIGLPEAEAAMLLKARQGDVPSIDALLTKLAAANNQLKTSKLFGEFGSTGPAAGTARAEVAAKAEELRKSNSKLTVQQARTEVRKANPDLAQRERDEERAAIRQVA